MTSKSAGLAVAIGLVAAVTARSAPPQIKGTAPFGVQRGVVSEVTVQGANLSGHPVLIAPFDFVVEPLDSPNADAANWKLKLNIAAETPIGVYPIRVATDDGLSNPFLFSVGQLPQVREKEDNNTFGDAQAIPSPVVVEGESAGNDVDYFKFTGKKGQRIVVDAQCARIGSGVDPSIRLTTASRTYIASADDSPGLLTDARLTALLPEDTEYVIELSDSRYQGGGRAVYRLVVGPVPVADEVFPIGGRAGETVGVELRGGTLTEMTVAAATLDPKPETNVFPLRVIEKSSAPDSSDQPALDVESLAPLAVSRLTELREPVDANAPDPHAAAPVALNGRLDPAGDVDRFVLAVTPGQKLRIKVEAAELSSALDGVLQVLGAKDAVLATADDTTIPSRREKGRGPGIVSPDPSLNFTVPAGLTEVTLSLRDLESRGGTGFPYRISVEPIVPSIEVMLNESEVSLPRNGTVAVGVTIDRQDYSGPITLTVANPPPGVTVRPGTIADGQTIGSFTLSASPEISFGIVNLEVTGEGKRADGPIVGRAIKSIVFAQQATLPTNTVTQHGLAAAPAQPKPVTLDAPATPIEVVHGFGAAIPVKAVRASGADAALAVTMLPAPPGLAVPDVKIAEKAAEANVTINAAPEAPLGATTIALIAKGKIAETDQTIGIPAVTLNVVRPAAIELAAPEAEIKAGSTIEVKGKVVRKAPFKEAVSVKLEKLPAGLKAEPVTVAPDATDFTIKVVAYPKAAAAMGSANVVVAFQLNKKDYPTPPTPLAVKVLPAQ